MMNYDELTPGECRNFFSSPFFRPSDEDLVLPKRLDPSAKEGRLGGWEEDGRWR